MTLMNVKELRKVIKTKYSDTYIYVQVGDTVYPIRADKVITNLSGNYIRLIADITQSRYEEPIE